MNRQTKTIKYVLLLGCLLLALTGRTFPLISLNGAGVAYTGDGPKLSEINENIEGMIIEGAGFILEGSENTSHMLRYMELQFTAGMDSSYLNGMIDKNLIAIQKARTTYAQLVRTAEKTPYNEVTLTLLKEFPYEEFQTNEGLNSVIFQEVAFFLRNGDVTGIFKRTYDSIVAIEGLMQNIKMALTTNPGEGITLAWKLNETNADLLLFGSYVARVFAGLK